MLRISITFLFAWVVSSQVFSQLYTPEIKVKSTNNNLGIGDFSARNPLTKLEIKDGSLSLRGSGGRKLYMGWNGRYGGSGKSENDGNVLNKHEISAFNGAFSGTALYIHTVQLDASGSFRDMGGLKFERLGNTSSGNYHSSIHFTTRSHPNKGPYTRMTIDNYGRVAIGTSTSYAYHLLVKGNAYAEGGNWLGSDIKLKKNVTKYRHGLEVVKRLNPVEHELKAEADSIAAFNKQKGKKLKARKYVSVLAQELQAVAPELVEPYLNEENEETLAINQTGLIFLLVNSVKDLNAKLEEQQQLIDSLLGTKTK